MATVAPNWLNPPETKWINCLIQGSLEPNEYAVELEINGVEVTAAVPRNFIRAPKKLPNEGGMKVMVVAKLSNDHVLAELPALPMNGTRRINVNAARLLDEWNAPI